MKYIDTKTQQSLKQGIMEFLGLSSGEMMQMFMSIKYIILQTLPRKMSDTEIIGIEAMYKNRFLTKEFGLNDN